MLLLLSDPIIKNLEELGTRKISCGRLGRPVADFDNGDGTREAPMPELRWDKEYSA